MHKLILILILKIIPGWEDSLKKYGAKIPVLMANKKAKYGAKLVQQNLISEPITIRRFTRKVAEKYYGKKIFSNLITGILFLDTPGGKILLVCDWWWHRVCWINEGSPDIHAFGEKELNKPSEIVGKYPYLFVCDEACGTDSMRGRIVKYKIVIDSVKQKGRWIKYVKDIVFVKFIGENKFYWLSDIDYSDNGTPYDITDDCIYAADVSGNAILKFDLNGNLLSKVSIGDRFFSPREIAVGKSNGVNTKDIYVVLWGGTDYKIVKYRDTANIVNITGCYELRNSVLDIKIDNFGYPYITWSGFDCSTGEYTQDKIVKFKKDLSDTLWTYGGHGFGDGKFFAVKNMCIYNQEMFVTEAYTDSSGISYYWIEGVRDTIPPVVKILSPPCSTYVNHLIKIVGTVKDESAIKYWQIYWGEGVNPSKWNFINFDTRAIEKSVLGEWDTYGLTPWCLCYLSFCGGFWR